MISDVVAFGEEHLSEIWDQEDQAELTRLAIEQFHRARLLCESPIEVMMLAGLIGLSFGYSEELNLVVPSSEVAKVDRSVKSHIIVPQMEVPQFRYRTDFFVSLYTYGDQRVGFFVECDGHEYHERTKEQASRDRKRDRQFQSLGLNVLRFTGSDLHRDFDGCRDELDTFGSNLIEREWARNGHHEEAHLWQKRKMAFGHLADG